MLTIGRTNAIIPLVVVLACGLLLLVNSSTARRVAGGSNPFMATCGTAPAPAVTWGFTRNVLCVKNLSQIDVNATGLTGYSLYPLIGWPGQNGGSGGGAGTNGGPQQATGPSSMFSAVVGGGFQILPPNPTVGFQLTTCFYNGTPNSWNGTAYTGGMYLKIEIISAPIGHSSVGNQWWPVFWMAPTEIFASVAPGPASFTEVDAFESQVIDGSEVAATIGWVPGPTWATSSHSFTDPFQGDNGVGGVGGTHTNQSYAALIVPPALNGGTGIVAGYFQNGFGPNDVINPRSPNTINFTTSQQINQLIGQHNCVLVSSGDGQAFAIKSVQVWQ